MGDSTPATPALPAPKAAGDGGVQVQHGSTTVQASNEVVQELRAWADGNPLEFGLILVFLAFWVWQTRIGKRERSQHGVEFERVRRDIREAPKARKEKK